MKLSINQCAAAINAVGQHTTVLIEGPSGSGKSSVLGMLNMPKHRKVYIDCTQIDVGDIQIPSVNHTTGTSTFYPNEVFGVHDNVPVVICLDEFGKAPRSVQNALLPVVLDRRVGNRPLPGGSMVFATTNLSSEGVGDTLPLHVRNRMSVVRMRKPNVEEYINYSLANNGNPAVLAWVKETPQVLAEDDDVANPDQNPYIWHRKDPGRKAFCSPRSMTAAGRVLNDGEHIDDDTMRAVLAGLIGARSAADLHVYVQMGNKLPSWNSIVTAPLQAAVPDTPTMCMMLVHRAITRTTEDTLDAVMVYMKRLPMELQAVFVNQFLRIPQRSKFGALNDSFTKWCMANNWVMG